jgi:hypothetical protein
VSGKGPHAQLRHGAPSFALVAVRLKPAATAGKGPPSWVYHPRRHLKMGLSRSQPRVSARRRSPLGTPCARQPRDVVVREADRCDREQDMRAAYTAFRARAAARGEG